MYKIKINIKYLYHRAKRLQNLGLSKNLRPLVLICVMGLIEKPHPAVYNVSYSLSSLTLLCSECPFILELYV